MAHQVVGSRELARRFSLMNENVTHSLKPAAVASRRSARFCSSRSSGGGGTCARAGNVAGSRS